MRLAAAKADGRPSIRTSGASIRYSRLGLVQHGIGRRIPGEAQTRVESSRRRRARSWRVPAWSAVDRARHLRSCSARLATSVSPAPPERRNYCAGFGDWPEPCGEAACRQSLHRPPTSTRTLRQTRQMPIAGFVRVTMMPARSRQSPGAVARVVAAPVSPLWVSFWLCLCPCPWHVHPYRCSSFWRRAISTS